MRVTANSIMRLWAKSLKNQRDGKIKQSGNGMILSDKGWQGTSRFFAPFPDDLGRMVSFASSKSYVQCPDNNPEIYPLVREMYRVPKSVCAKCQHRLKNNCCAILRDQAKQVTP